MKLFVLTLYLALLLTQSLFSQKDLPVIKSNSEIADIRNGREFRKGNWTISPDINPDVFHSSALGENLVFITDLDSITIPITESTDFDFIVLLRGKKAVTKIKYSESYLRRLKKAGNYNTNDNRFIPNFTYQSSDSENLVKIRRDLKLDSIGIRPGKCL